MMIAAHYIQLFTKPDFLKKKKKKKKWRPEFGLIWTKSGLKLGFLPFSQVWFIIFP